jgi:hypothetical protein
MLAKLKYSKILIILLAGLLPLFGPEISDLMSILVIDCNHKNLVNSLEK